VTLGTPFPNDLKATSRTFDQGDFPVKKYDAQDGSEFRILYGDKRVKMRMQVTFANIPDTEAQKIFNHYHENQGTFKQFLLGDTSVGGSGTKVGWQGEPKWLAAGNWGSHWRYENAPQLQSVYPGVSTVTVNFIGATF